jgi:protease-4
MAEVVHPYPTPRKHGRLGLLVTLLLLAGLTGSALLNLVLLAASSPFESGGDVREEYFSSSAFRQGAHKVAIITLEGVILNGEGAVKRQIDRAAEDEAVKAVVLRVNSPGGTITGSDYLYHHLSELREKAGKPIVVSMGGIAASGGYYVSMAAGPTPDTIFAEPTTWTGSIGVIIPHYNAAKLMQTWGVEEDSVASHRLKNMGSLAREMTEEERQIFQALVDESFDRFKAIIRGGRPEFEQAPERLDKLATGQVYAAQQAQENGLIDRIGFIEDAVDRAIELAQLDRGDVEVVRYKAEPTLASLLFGRSAAGGGFDLKTLSEMTTPQAYYLWTQLPPLVHSAK